MILLFNKRSKNLKIAVMFGKSGLPITSGMASLYKRGKLVGYCLDTPNAIACVVGNKLATTAKDCFGEVVVVDKNRAANRGWLKLESCGFVKVGE
jgi:hypothetical protein